MRDVRDFYARFHLSGAVQVPKEDQSAKIEIGVPTHPTYMHTYLYVQLGTISLISCENRPARRDWDLARKPTHPSGTVLQRDQPLLNSPRTVRISLNTLHTSSSHICEHCL